MFVLQEKKVTLSLQMAGGTMLDVSVLDLELPTP